MHPKPLEAERSRLSQPAYQAGTCLSATVSVWLAIMDGRWTRIFGVNNLTRRGFVLIWLWVRHQTVYLKSSQVWDRADCAVSTSKTQLGPPSAAATNPAFPKLHLIKHPWSPFLRRTIPVWTWKFTYPPTNHMCKQSLWWHATLCLLVQSRLLLHSLYAENRMEKEEKKTSNKTILWSAAAVVFSQQKCALFIKCSDTSWAAVSIDKCGINHFLEQSWFSLEFCQC